MAVGIKEKPVIIRRTGSCSLFRVMPVSHGGVDAQVAGAHLFSDKMMTEFGNLIHIPPIDSCDFNCLKGLSLCAMMKTRKYRKDKEDDT